MTDSLSKTGFISGLEGRAQKFCEMFKKKSVREKKRNTRLDFGGDMNTGAQNIATCM